MTWQYPTTSEEYFGMPPLWEDQRRRQDYIFEQVGSKGPVWMGGLYVIRDRELRPRYVGQGEIVKRVDAHIRSGVCRPELGDIVQVKVNWDRAESAAIAGLRPELNVQGNRDPLRKHWERVEYMRALA